MPAIMTHDTFGREMLTQFQGIIGSSFDERDAFLLGNQGPDPLFYAAADPRLKSAVRLGTVMHDERPISLIETFRKSVDCLPEEYRHIGRAYVLGFLCHYKLDSAVHPLVFYWQYGLCDAGVEGLTRKQGGSVHAFIETQFDELILTMRRNTSTAHINPARDSLHASDLTLDIISALYQSVAQYVYGIKIPSNAFYRAVMWMRRGQALFYSPSGFKHSVLGWIETRVHPLSFYRAMSHTPCRRSESPFANLEHALWESPFESGARRESLIDLFEATHEQAYQAIQVFNDPNASRVDIEQHITQRRNFSGEVVVDDEG